MSENSEILNKYIAKVFDIQEKHKDRILNEADLKRISEELNLTESDMMIIEDEFKGHLNRGKGFLRHKNWEESIHELEQALSIKPYNISSMVLLSAAHQKKFYERKGKEDKELALKYARRTIQLDSTNDDAFRIITDLERKSKVSTNQESSGGIFKNPGRLIGIIVAVLAFFFLVGALKSILMVVLIVVILAAVFFLLIGGF